MKNRSGSWYFSAYFYDSYRHRVDKLAWRGEEGLWCNPVQRWTSDRVLGKDPRNASGHHPWSFYEITIDHRRQLHCNYIVHCPLALSITHHGLFLYSSHERVTCGIAFFPVSPTDAIISRLLPRYINISTFVRWSRLKCMLLSPLLSLFLLNHSFE